MGKNLIQKTLFIEGTTDDTNGDLRQGFSRLLEQELKENMPRIKMGNGKETTIKKFYSHKIKTEVPFVLIDLDDSEATKATALEKLKLKDKKDSVFFMVQEMESWILSQPEILDSYYKENISEKIKRKASEIPNPDVFLQDITRLTKKGIYHKVKHGVELLKSLDLKKLSKDFSDVTDMITALKK